MEDFQIISLLFQRSGDAISALQQKFGGLCKSIISNILTDRRDVDECVEDTYLRVWNSIPPQKPDRLDSYIGRIARNIALDRYDYNTAAARNANITLAFEELATGLPTGENEANQAEFRCFINRFLRELPKTTRIIFLRRYWYGDSVSQIAQACNCSEEKVKSSLFRTRNKLRQAMMKEEIYL